jgi:hypothetical protein
MKKWELYIDRIEENQEGEKLAVIELPDFSHFIIPLKYLPEKSQEGSLLEFKIRILEEK